MNLWVLILSLMVGGLTAAVFKTLSILKSLIEELQSLRSNVEAMKTDLEAKQAQLSKQLMKVEDDIWVQGEFARLSKEDVEIWKDITPEALGLIKSKKCRKACQKSSIKAKKKLSKSKGK